MEFDPGYSEKHDMRFIALRLPGFDFENDSNWDNLRAQLMACMRIMLPIVDAS